MFVTKTDETISTTRISGKDKHCSSLEMFQCSELTRARGSEWIGEAERALRSVNFSIYCHRDRCHYVFVQSYTTPRGNLMAVTDNDVSTWIHPLEQMHCSGTVWEACLVERSIWKIRFCYLYFAWLVWSLPCWGLNPCPSLHMLRERALTEVQPSAPSTSFPSLLRKGLTKLPWLGLNTFSTTLVWSLQFLTQPSECLRSPACASSSTPSSSLSVFLLLMLFFLSFSFFLFVCLLSFFFLSFWDRVSLCHLEHTGITHTSVLFLLDFTMNLK